MMIKAAEQMRRAALAMSRSDLIDKFQDWVEHLSDLLAPVHVKRLTCIEVRIDARRRR
jgi:hypothetical protein